MRTSVTRLSAAGDVERQFEAVDAAGDPNRAGAGIEREVERLQRERAIDSRGGVDAGGRGRAEQRHLEAAVFLQLEASIGRDGLADREADLLAAVVHAAPVRGRAVVREVGRKVGGRDLEIGAVHEHHHRNDPAEHEKPGKRPGQLPR